MTYSAPLIFTGSVLAIVSAIWSAILWTSFATSHQDKALAAVAAVALVACQTLFAAAAPEQPRALGIVIGLVAAVLVLASMAGTVGWLESRYQTLTATDTQRQQLLDAYTDKADGIRLQRQSAKEFHDLGYLTKAVAANAEADRMAADLIELSHQISALPAPNPAAAIASGLGERRWTLWTVLAALIDICPILCFWAAKNRPAPALSTELDAKHSELPANLEQGTDTHVGTIQTEPEPAVHQPSEPRPHWLDGIQPGTTLSMNKARAMLGVGRDKALQAMQDAARTGWMQEQDGKWIVGGVV